MFLSSCFLHCCILMRELPINSLIFYDAIKNRKPEWLFFKPTDCNLSFKQYYQVRQETVCKRNSAGLLRSQFLRPRLSGAE